MSRITERGATGPLSLTANGVFQTQAQTVQGYGGTVTDTSLNTLLGSRWDLSDGREVTLILAGAVNLAAGKMNQDAAIVANHQNLAITAIQTYSNNGNTPYQLTVTLGATLATANQYAGGLLMVNAGTGLGQTLKIASHPAAALSTSLVITLEDGPNTALATSDSKVCLITPRGLNVIVQPTTVTGAQVGVTMYPIAASTYGFVVSRGEVACLADGAIGVGLGISIGTVAGAVAVSAATTARLGFANQAGVDTEYRSVFVSL